MGDLVTFPGRSADPAAARNLAGVAQARAALRRGRARAIELDVDGSRPGDDHDVDVDDEQRDGRPRAEEARP